MYIRIFILFITILSIASCKNQDKKTTETHSDSDSATLVKKTGFSDKYFYKTLEGTIAGKPVVMHFLKHNDQIDANYYYAEKGQTIFLFKDWERDNTDSIYLIEDTNDGNGISPKIALHINEDHITGSWQSPNGKVTYPVTLKESSAASALHFTAFNYTDSAAYLRFKTDTPMLKSSVTMVMAMDDNNPAAWLNNTLKDILDNGNNKYASLTLPGTAQAIVNDAKNGYKAEADSSLVGIEIDPKSSSHYFLNREYTTTGNIIYNGNDYVVISLFNYAYTGGAHGNYGTSMYCFDVKDQKKLNLPDIVTADSVTLQGFLEKYYREQYHMPATTPLDKNLFVKNLAANDNFYFSPRGLGFIYTPYEIASYADGEINVWIPFSALKPYLNPEFAKRMAL